MDTLTGAANRRILIIDDTASIHQDYRKILGPEEEEDLSLESTETLLFGVDQPQRQVFELDSAYQGQEALELVRLAQAANRPYAMAFIDMRMPPGWDGLETIEQLWKVDPHLQVALCTAYSDYSWESMADRLAFGDQLLILKKPFDSLEIRQMASALTWKWQLARDMATRMSELERTVEERVQELLHVSRLLQFDVLTELPNSTLLVDRLSQAIALAKRHDEQTAVMFIGLDRFKRINNALGHPVGDEMLKHVARCLIGALRQSDSVFRYGSDEFVLVLPDIAHPHQTNGIAQKILNAVNTPLEVAGHALRVTASMGISLYPGDGEEALGLVKKAETAMRNTKEEGHGNFGFFIEDMNLRARRQQSIESGIRLALERDEFVLHYQPKLDLRRGQVVGAEALIRWLHPERGWIFPGDFIPVAEDSGLIVPLSRWVVGQACRQAKAWQEQGLGRLIMSVNVSAIDFRQRDYLDRIRQVLEETGLDPHCLELEITESILMQNIDATLEVLHALKALGIRLAIDDFGTGYSSLSYLRRFPVDVLKIDQSFVRNLAGDQNDAALVSAIISLGKSLNLNTIAEGVETREQLDFLKAHACEEVQGYYFSKAVEANAFASLLQDWREKAPGQD
ncbi:response regulator receiver modulated diguanylate cyclase/phosphodiesterase [Pseudomonas asplenii]|uniref:cyclic-guanylate-specific phosphodiesterase n=1 Tax=Pseudomonas asplenii TaxID=53407 RepID=A0A0M9GKK9_9PSED|nr:EAL domain-containing protein [Pseudomonas fuscovaginae]KPA93258.1 response regulator receiver modulated diguanylate cyclase/phosphodiesterase [Pseudomonas fuscovaginae]